MINLLGLYYFGADKNEEEHVSQGHLQVALLLMMYWAIYSKKISFGGVGPSGIGNYHGEEGFKTFSNAKAVYKQIGSRFDKLLSAIRLPYKGDIEKVLKQIT